MYTIKVKVENNQVNLLTTEIPITEGSLNTLECEFELPSEYEGLTCVAVFTSYENKHYKRTILDNKCEIPPDVLKTDKYVILGVYAYNTTDELIYSPYVTGFEVKAGSYKEGSEEEMIYTPSDYDKWLEEARVIYLNIAELYQPTLDNYAEIQKQVAELEGDVDGLETRVSTLSTRVSYLEDIVTDYEKKLRDQFKNEFESLILEGNSFYIDDAAERPLGLIPYGEPVQTVIEEELGTTIEGESVVVADGDVKKEVKATVNGNSYQYSTEGYNLYNVNDKKPFSTGITVDNEDYITITIDNSTGEKTVYGNAYTNKNDKLLVDTTYYLVTEIKSVNGTGTFFPFTSIENEGQISSILGYKTYPFSNLKKGDIFVQQIKTVTDFSKSTTMLRTLCKFEAGQSGSITFRLSLLKDAITVDTFKYEPYTGGQASPNIEYPQEVEVIDGVNRFKLVPQLKIFSSGVPVGDDTKDVINNYDDNNINYTLSGGYVGFISEPIKLKKGETLNVNSISNHTFTYLRLAFIQVNSDGSYTNLKSITGNLSGSYIATEDITVIVAYWTNDSATIDFSNIIATTVPNAPYLPYGHIGLVQRGKNVLDIQDLIANSVVNTSVTKGIALYLKPNTSYTISTNMVSDNNSSDHVVPMVGEPQANNAYVFVTTNSSLTSFSSSNNGVGTVDNKIRTIITNNTGYLFIGVRYSYHSNLSSLISQGGYIQVEEGTVATKNEPYIEPIVKPINLEGNSIAKVGDVKDLLNIGVDGRVSIEKKINKIIGTELINDNRKFELSTSYSDDTYICCFYNWLLTYEENSQQRFPMCSPNNKFILCNKLLNGHYVHSKTKEQIGIESSLGITLLKSRYATIEEVNNLIKDEDFEFYYSLATPQTINLPSIEPIKLIEGITNVFELVTNLGTTMAVTYDYVTPSPSIDRPSEILTVKGSYDTEKDNQNLIKFGKIIGSVHESNGVTFTIKSKTTVNVKGTATDGNAEIFLIGYNWVDAQPMLKLRDNIKYTATMKVNTPNVYIYLIKGASENIANLYTNTKTKTFTADEKGISKIMLRVMKGTTVDEDIELQLEYGENSTEIVEPKNTTLPLALTKELLGEIVTLTEEEAKQLNLDGAGKYRRMDYGRYVFTGDENWQFSTGWSTDAYKCFFATILQDTKFASWEKVYTKSNYFMAYSRDELLALQGNGIGYSGIVNDGINTNNAPITIKIDSSVASTVDEFKAWLKSLYDAGNPMEVIYELATPTYEKITDETELQQLSAYDKQIAFFGVNNINTFPTDDLVKAPLGLKVTYDKSNRIIIQRQAETIANQDKRIAALEETVNTMLGGQ